MGVSGPEGPADTARPAKAGGWRARLASGGFVRDIGLLLAGSGGAQLITLLGAPLLARIYRPEEFAALALLTSSFQIISRFSSLKYETALATGRNRAEMGTLAALATYALFAATLGTLIYCVAFFPFIATKIGHDPGLAFCMALPVIVLLDGLIQIVITWSVRWREFRTVSTNDVLRNGFSVGTQAGLGLSGMGGPGLLFGQVVGSSFALALLCFRPSTGELYALARRSSWTRRKVVARRFIDFPLFQMPKAILTSASINMPTILVAAYYSAQSTALFFFAYRLTALPAQLVSQSLGRALMQRFAELHNQQSKPITRLLGRSTMGLALLGSPMIVMLFLFGEPIFAIFLGQNWRPAGSMAAWTMLWSAATICGTPAQMAMTVLRQNRTMLLLEALFLPLRLAPFVVFAGGKELTTAIILSCIAAVLFNLVVIAAALIASRSVAAAHPATKGAL